MTGGCNVCLCDYEIVAIGLNRFKVKGTGHRGGRRCHSESPFGRLPRLNVVIVLNACYFVLNTVISRSLRREILKNQCKQMIEKAYYVYLLTNWNNKVMYVGMTNDLQRRIYEHKEKSVKGFTKKYNVNKLVYYEQTSDVDAALNREKEIKKWRREKKDSLVENTNPLWRDLSEDFL
jgi:putative endonuclease